LACVVSMVERQLVLVERDRHRRRGQTVVHSNFPFFSPFS
jgi:hypothetical protein